ncbi:MAG: hypothetical protein QG620_366 [Patescibacteria group bacterium]|nr:hypothetical protein [Patescibacteria group bacterium]
MYWIFLILFVVAVLVPDLVRNDFHFLSEQRLEEVLIFLIGAAAFFVFIYYERLISFHKREKEKDRKKIDQTVKDLVESYSYIGEVNRKMDILMNIALGLSDRSMLSKDRETEIYESIISAANFLMKAEKTSLRFVNFETGRTEKEIKTDDTIFSVKNSQLTVLEENINVKKLSDELVVLSSQKINGIKSCLIIADYDKEEETSPKNIEILKVFASQAIFLYSYTHSKTGERN